MLRVILIEAALFLLPFAAYALFLVLTRGGIVRQDFLQGPFLWLIAAGLALAAVSLAIFGAFTGRPPDAVYVPPRYEDGVLVPGHVEPRGDRPSQVRP